MPSTYGLFFSVVELSDDISGQKKRVPIGPSAVKHVEVL